MLLVLEIFRTNLFLSETNCSSLLSVAVISVAVVANVYSVESSAYIDTLALLKVSGMSLVKIENARDQNSYPGEFLILDYVGGDSIKEHRLYSVRQVTLYPQYSRGSKAITHKVFNFPKFSYVTTLLHTLHWLPVEAHFHYKTMVRAYGTARGTPPPYLQAVLKPYTLTRALTRATRVTLYACDMWLSHLVILR